MNFQETLGKFFQEKDDEIKSLKEQNDKLKEEIDRLKQQQEIDPQIPPGRYGDVKEKAENLKKALDNFLSEHPNSNRPGFHYRPQTSTIPSVSLPTSVDANKPSTSTRPGPADDLSVNGKFNRYNGQEDFSARQDFRRKTDEQIVDEANPTEQHYHHNINHSNHIQTTLPTTFPNNGNNSQKRFHSGYVNGTNNNNINRNNRNNNNNNNKYTIFVSWPGSVTKEQLHELFEHADIDVADIRYTAPKQFAHVDLKSEQALNKAMTLNGQTRNDKQGQLRVEVGKPRSSNTNPTENGQRPQNQNKNFIRQNNKPNGYNPNSPQKQNKYTPNYVSNHHSNHNGHNNHNGTFSSYVPSEEKESVVWQPPPSSMEVAKQNGDSNN